MNLKQTRHVINARTDNHLIIDQDKFSLKLNSEYLFKNKNISKHLIVGVSGGPDSMLLSYLLKKHSENYEWKITAVIIDHKLREGSKKEALLTKKRLEIMGLDTIILNLSKYHKNTGIQEWARFQRLNALSGFARSMNGVLLLGHHLNDQVETVYMRMIKGTGVWGAFGMKPISSWYGTTVMRPLLVYSKEIILNTCKENFIKYVDDKTNSNEKFERVRVRNLINNIQDKEKFITNINNFSFNIRKICEKVDQKIKELCTIHFPLFDLGWSNIDVSVLTNLNKDISLRILLLRIKTIGGGKYYVKKSKVQELLNHFNIYKDDLFNMPGKTLGGCKIFYRKKKISIVRWSKENIENKEMPNVGNFIFDNRWEIFSRKKIKFGYLQNFKISHRENKILKKIDIPYEVWRYIPVNIDSINFEKLVFNLDVGKSNNHLNINDVFFNFLLSLYDVKLKFIK